MDRTGSFFNPSHNNAKIRYQGTARLPLVTPADLRKDPPDYPEEIRDTYLQLPRLDPRIKKLAENITARSTNDYDKAANIQRYLIANYAYTLDLTELQARIRSPISFLLAAPGTANISPRR